MVFIKYEIRFKKNQLEKIKRKLFSREEEQYCILIGKMEETPLKKIYKIYDVIYPKEKDLESYSKFHISIKKNFIYEVLKEMESRLDVDTLLEIHTHPFLKNDEVVDFSFVDDRDEIDFGNYLQKEYPNITYGSLVFSKGDYRGRIFIENEFKDLKIKENIYKKTAEKLTEKTIKIYDRNVKYMGLQALRKININSKISIIGLGGLGSIIAENLLHMGVKNFILVDDDVVDYSNLNRMTGAKYIHAVENKYKVEVVKEHLLEINPEAEIEIFPKKIFDEEVIERVIDSTRIFLVTDNHWSRAFVNDLCIRYYIPFISVGVNITVKENQISDISGEIIKIFPGDKFCLRCLGRINQKYVDYEKSTEIEIRNKMIDKGYIETEKEPAVKTLNSVMASLAVDSYINESINNTKEFSIMVYENNIFPKIYEEKIKIKNIKDCFICH